MYAPKNLCCSFYSLIIVVVAVVTKVILKQLTWVEKYYKALYVVKSVWDVLASSSSDRLLYTFTINHLFIYYLSSNRQITHRNKKKT